MQPDYARRRSDEMGERHRRRLAELDDQARLSSQLPVIVGSALVIPSGLVARAGGEAAAAIATRARDTAAVERRAVDAVLAVEARLGRTATEMPHNNPGFDVRAITANGHLLLIEVKGRIAGSDTFTVTRNEILTGLNAGDGYLVALVEVSPDGDAFDRVRYLRRPFTGAEAPFFGTASVTFDWKGMWEQGGDPT
jgi:hypothetical protein